MESVPDPCYMMDMVDSEIYYAVAMKIKKSLKKLTTCLQLVETRTDHADYR